MMMACTEIPPFKVQWVRLFDVFLLGPVMVLGGAALVATRRPGLGLFLMAAGVGTSVYNGAGYHIVRQREKLLAEGERWPGAPV